MALVLINYFFFILLAFAAGLLIFRALDFFLWWLFSFIERMVR